MWKNLQITPDKSTLNQLLQSILKLECETKDVPKFVDLFKRQQERLHECKAGQKVMSLEDLIISCVFKFPVGNGWEDFKLRHDATPATSWKELQERVEKHLSITGQLQLPSLDEKPHHHRENPCTTEP